MARAETAMTPYTTRKVRPSDQNDVLELMRITLGEKQTTRKTAEYWSWKHVENPFGASYALCAEDPSTRQMVGLRPLMHWRFVDRAGTEYTAVRPVDTATHPEHQRRGIFSSLTRLAIEDLGRTETAFIFNTPNDNSRPGYLKMGWKVVEHIPVLVRPVWSPRTVWRALLGRRRQDDGLRSPVAAGLHEWRRFSREHRSVIEALVAGHEQRRLRTGYRTCRDLAYLDWRYGAHPDIRYGVHATTDANGAIDGFLIARPASGVRGLGAMVLTEAFVREPSVGALRRLIRSAIRSVPCDYWVTHFPLGTLERDALRRLGFFKAGRRGFTLTALPLRRDIADPVESGNWDLTLGELEIF